MILPEWSPAWPDNYLEQSKMYNTGENIFWTLFTMKDLFYYIPLRQMGKSCDSATLSPRREPTKLRNTVCVMPYTLTTIPPPHFTLSHCRQTVLSPSEMNETYLRLGLKEVKSLRPKRAIAFRKQVPTSVRVDALVLH